MKIQQRVFNQRPNLVELKPLVDIAPQLLMVFGSVEMLEDPVFFANMKESFSEAKWIGCSTAGEISSDGVSDETLVVTALNFNNPDFKVAITDIHDMEDSFSAGKRLAETLNQPDLKHILVIAQGVQINGSALIEGIQAGCEQSVSICGGLAGDGGAFKRTVTLSHEAVSEKQIVALGFVGENITLQHGTFGGWQPFGPARKVTKSVGNVLYELDNEPALGIYKKYLGDHAKDLPASGLLFPFEMLGEDHNSVGLVRTILAVNEEEGSLILAGDIIENGYLKLMHASTDALVDGAEAAAEAAATSFNSENVGLTLLVSCVGRKLVMGARVDEEVEAVGDVFGVNSVLTGFYSYGEISPFLTVTNCKLHNQTMTITYVTE